MEANSHHPKSSSLGGQYYPRLTSEEYLNRREESLQVWIRLKRLVILYEIDIRRIPRLTKIIPLKRRIVVFSFRIRIAINAAKKGLTLKRAELRVVPIILRAANIIHEPIPSPNIPPDPNKINDRVEGMVVFLLEE